MKQRLIGILVWVGLIFGVYGQPQTTAPDVYLQWELVGQPLTNAASQTITIPMPQSGISKYSYHYVYVYISAPCMPVYIDYGTYGSLTGSVPITSTTSRNISIGGLISQNVVGNLQGGSALLMKGNGAVNSLSASLTLLAGSGFNFSACTMDVLYKGTTKEEEGNNALGVYNPTEIYFSTVGITPSVTANGTATWYSYNINTYGFGATAFNNTIAIDAMYFCVNPSFYTGLYRATSPVTLEVSIASTNLGVYSVTNSCMNIQMSNRNLGLIQKGGSLQAIFIFPSAVAYPTAWDGELQLSVYGHVVF
jgi:hypothetical protein